jgi:tripartite ATP-independent transporter DctM subunit
MIILFLLFLFLLIISIPIGIALGLTSTIYFLINGTIPGMMIPQRMVAGTTQYIMLAVPFFILAGNIMNSAGITRRIFDFADNLVGHIKGGLSHVNIIASLIFSGMSGSAIADVAGLGTIEITAMKEKGYPADFSAAVTAASAIIGPIVPPSVPLIIFGVTARVSVISLFMGGFIPGLLLALVLMLTTYFIAKKRHFPVNKKANFKKIIKSFFEAFWALMTPTLIIGGLFSGIFTPTEASVIAVVYTLFVGLFIYKDIKLKDIPSICIKVANETGIVFLLLAGGSIFGWLLSIEQIPQAVCNSVLSFSENPIIILLTINLLLLFIGCFMPPVPVILILSPILLPIVYSIGVNPIHFGVVMVFNLMLGLLTPPVGSCLYVSARIARISFSQIVKAISIYYPALIAVLLLLTYFPKIVLFLPNLLD